jgi:hypothetical protein
MNILVACEFSGAVRDAFRALGHSAWSCDLLPCDSRATFHIRGDALEAIARGRPTDGKPWDVLIAFPPCTYLCSSGMHWTTRGKRDPKLTEDALQFVAALLNSKIPHVALENPVGAISTRIRKPDQIIHPYKFGHPESKTTCLWLKNLPLLRPTNVLVKNGPWANQTPSGQNKLGPSATRWKERSKTYQGIAQAMASQWSAFLSSSPAISPRASVAENRIAPRTIPTLQTALALDQ